MQTSSSASPLVAIVTPRDPLYPSVLPLTLPLIPTVMPVSPALKAKRRGASWRSRTKAARVPRWQPAWHRFAIPAQAPHVRSTYIHYAGLLVLGCFGSPSSLESSLRLILGIGVVLRVLCTVMGLCAESTRLVS